MIALKARIADFPLLDFSRWRDSLVGILGAVMACVCIGLIVLEQRGASPGGSQAATEAVFRASSFVFLIWFICEPVAGLFPDGLTGMFGRERETLLLAFVGAYATFLAFVTAPFFLSGTQIPVATLVFGAVAGLVASALVTSAHRHGPRLLGDEGWRRVNTLAMGYFWLLFAFVDVTHLYGPHRPDRFYGISILFLIGALLLRFAAALVRKMDIRLRI